MGAEKNQPASALNEPDYVTKEEREGPLAFRSGAQNEEGGNLVEDPTDATNGAGSPDIKGPGPDHMIFKDDPENTSKLNEHVTATSDPMGNTEAAERSTASGVTEYAKSGKTKGGKK